jgi:hypothetical protein
VYVDELDCFEKSVRQLQAFNPESRDSGVSTFQRYNRNFAMATWPSGNRG